MAAQLLSTMSISTALSPSGSGRTGSPSLLHPINLKFHSLKSSLHGDFDLRSSNSCRVVRTRRSSITTVSFMLPTAKPDRVPADKIPKWSARAIKSFGMAELEARKLKYPTTGTEDLLLGILVQGTSFAAKFLRANGITLFKVREEVVKLLGKSDLYFFSPERPPLTERAQRALDWAIDEKLKSGDDGEVTTTHLLLGIWSEKDSAGHKIMATYGFDEEKAKELAKSIDQDAGLNYR